MQALSKSRSLVRVLKPPILISTNHEPLPSLSQIIPSPQWQRQEAFSPQISFFSGVSHGSYAQIQSVLAYSKTWGTFFSTKTGSAEGSPTEAVKELYDKMLESVNVKRSMPPNAWLWSLIENCQNQDDIKLLFDILQNLRRFRLSNLRIHTNFNCNLCREIAKTCVRVGAIDFGKKTLCKHNVYGLTPSIGSAHHLLSYAQDHKDLELMVEILKLVTRNGLPLQPGTADIFFRICYEMNNWELLSKYSKRFAKAGVKFRKTTFDTWMTFAAKIGDTKSLWEIEKKRSEFFKDHTLASAFSCVKGLLLEHKPEDAAAIIEVLNQTLHDEKKLSIMGELQKLVNEWPLDVVKHQTENTKGLAAALKNDITTMLTHLQKIGLGAPLDVTIPV